MLLSDSEPGVTYEVRSLAMAQDSLRRFEILGMLPGSRITVLRGKKSGARIIRLRGTRYAVGSAFAASIELTEVTDK